MSHEVHDSREGTGNQAGKCPGDIRALPVQPKSQERCCPREVHGSRYGEEVEDAALDRIP